MIEQQRKDLEQELTVVLLDWADHIVQETNGRYNPITFRLMLKKGGGKETVKKLIKSLETKYGFNVLLKLDRLDLSVESFILKNEKYHPLFDEGELTQAKMKLKREP